MPVNTANGKIYAIRSHQTEKIYIGSTCQTLAQRLGKHRNRYKHWKLDNSKSYMTSYEILEYPDHYIELLELCPCSTRDELSKREGELIREHDCVNKVVEGRTKAEYYKDNKEKVKNYSKKYREDNKEKEKERHKKYREDNIEKVKKTDKKYREDNKEKLKAHKSEKIECPYCDTTYTRADKARHFRTTKHIKNFIQY